MSVPTQGPPNDNTKRADNPVVEERGKNPAVFQGKGSFIKQKSGRWNIRGKPKPIQNKYMQGNSQTDYRDIESQSFASCFIEVSDYGEDVVQCILICTVLCKCVCPCVCPCVCVRNGILIRI